MKNLELKKEQLIKEANNWYERHGDNARAYITKDGDSGVLWHRQQVAPENTIWTYNGRTKEQFNHS